tara:strand:+ start:1189 stop:1428 length:240 start_codon:yes stop_codon:yes gene_type:complete
MTQKKQPLVLKEHNFFASYNSLEEVMDFMTRYAGKDKAYLCHMTQAFTINAIVKAMDEQCDGTAVCERAKPLFRIEETT